MTGSQRLNRRAFVTGAAVLSLSPRQAAAMTPFRPGLVPPMTGREDYVRWMVANRGEDPAFLGQRWDRFLALVAHRDVWDERDKAAYLLTPREEFVTKANLSRAYEWHYLDIGFGVTITGPHTVARMTNTLEIGPGEKVLEIGTGSGYQSAYLSYLTNQIFSIEIIHALAERTRAVYDGLIARGYSEYQAIATRTGDGYYGWEEHAPFVKIIVTCGIDHIPPPLLQQLKTGGIMVIPIGPPGARHVLKVVKQAGADGAITVSRSDIYGGAVINFVPLTQPGGGMHKAS
ncbi:MAG TPA: protein-L-isoaspartate O-methyltransferase [Roseiarcus sp.]|nr:protein-L-isoaspartate O-methyltransferase [Roseiarcus sp.]